MDEFFRTLIRPDREESPERAEVARAANLLQVGEFQLLQLAYHDWHGDDMPAALIDRLFSTYMLYNQVPHWARHYARRIIGLDVAGMLDDRDPRYHRYDPVSARAQRTGAHRFALVTAIVMLCIFGGLWTAHLAVFKDGGSRSVLPPYFGKDELKRVPR